MTREVKPRCTCDNPTLRVVQRKTVRYRRSCRKSRTSRVVCLDCNKSWRTAANVDDLLDLSKFEWFRWRCRLPATAVTDRVNDALAAAARLPSIDQDYSVPRSVRPYTDRKLRAVKD